MTKKIVRRRAAKPPQAPHPVEKPQTLPTPGEGETTPCACGKMSLTMDGDEAVIRGSGFVHSFRYAYCGHCQTKITFSPLLMWETSTGHRYTTAERTAQGETLRTR